MSGLTDLDQLLAHLEPSLREGEYVFITVDDDAMTDELQPLATFAEDEGRSLIVELERADDGFHLLHENLLG